LEKETAFRGELVEGCAGKTNWVLLLKKYLLCIFIIPENSGWSVFQRFCFTVLKYCERGIKLWYSKAKRKIRQRQVIVDQRVIKNVFKAIIHCYFCGYFCLMHIGEKVKARAKELRIGPTELGKKIRTSKQNVYGIYQRSSIDTGLLQKLSKALDFDFFVYYTTTGNSGTNTPRTGYKKNRKGNNSSEDEIISLHRELKEFEEKYELLKALYEAKTGKKVPGSLS
jgi:hypothetical protein